MSINVAIISGNLTRDPELRATPGGTAVLRFGVAVNSRRKNQQTGRWEDCPNFIDCAMFGARAEKIAGYLDKGAKVAIKGELRYSAWEGRDGQRRSKVEIVVEDIEFMSRAENSAQGQQNQAYAPQAANPAPAPAQGYQAPQNASQAAAAVRAAFPGAQVVPTAAAVYDEDIPF